MTAQHFSPRQASIGIVCLALAVVALGLTGCTRERPGPPKVETLVVPMTPTGPITTPGTEAGQTVIPVSTLHVTPAPATVEATVAPAQRGETSGGGSEVVATPEPSEPAAPANTFRYKVKAGDTLSAIAARFGVTTRTLVNLNNLTDPSTLRVGQEILVPGEGPADTQTGKGYTHKVKAGETLYGIALQYGIPLDKLAAANNISDPSTIRVGQRLIIPAKGGAGSSPGSGVRIHVVQPGETLSAIAARYGTTPKAIMKANNLANANSIISGQRLTIPVD